MYLTAMLLNTPKWEPEVTPQPAKTSPARLRCSQDRWADTVEKYRKAFAKLGGTASARHIAQELHITKPWYTLTKLEKLGYIHRIGLQVPAHAGLPAVVWEWINEPG